MKYNTKINLVDEFEKKLADEQKLITKELRRIICESAFHLEEGLKWGYPCYFFYGPVCYLNVQDKGVNLGFFNGSDLADADKMLDADGNRLEYIKIQTVADIKAEFIAERVRQAVEMNKNVASNATSTMLI